MPNFIDKMLQ
jgi:hypothetical protein